MRYVVLHRARNIYIIQIFEILFILYFVTCDLRTIVHNVDVLVCTQARTHTRTLA